jgi:pimeloyl-ACP methyl ester carboxylesterase
MTIERGIAEINGTRLAYEIAGDGPPVFIHGFTLDHRIWDDQMPVFAERHRVLRYDLRGFGASAQPELGQPYTHVDDLRALLTHLGIERAAVVGLSLGGWVALEFTLTYPDSVDALIVVDSALRGYQYSPQGANTIDTFYRLGGEGRLVEAKAGWLADPLFAYSIGLPAVGPRLTSIVDTYSCWHLQHQDPHTPMDPPARERLQDIAVPTLVIVDILVKGIPGARKLVLPNAGHMVNMDAPDAFNRAVLDFLAPATAGDRDLQ